MIHVMNMRREFFLEYFRQLLMIVPSSGRTKLNGDLEVCFILTIKSRLFAYSLPMKYLISFLHLSGNKLQNQVEV